MKRRAVGESLINRKSVWRADHSLNFERENGSHEWRTSILYARGYPIYIHTAAALAFAPAYTNAMDGNPTAEALEGRRDAGPGITISSFMHRAFDPLLCSVWQYATRLCVYRQE